MKIPIDQVNKLGKEEFAANFGSVFEGSSWIAEKAWPARPFGSLAELHAAFVGVIRGAHPEKRLALIRAHPDLAGKAALADELTPESREEQASAGLDRLTPEEYEAFTETNRAYRERFGFPMIICVREHTKESILDNARSRLENPRDEEVEVALAEIAKISRLRLQELVESDPCENPRENQETSSKEEEGHVPND